MKSEFNRRIGARVREQRELLGISREQLCGYVCISPQFLSEVERGVKGVSAETLYKLCDGLKLSADTVLMGRKEPSDVSGIAAVLSVLDEKYLLLAEDLLRIFIKAVAMKTEPK